MQYPFEPIGFVRSPFTERMEAPRQAPGGAPGRIELLPGRGFEDALEGLDAWDYAWILFVFHENVAQGRGWSPKVQPPRSTEKQGVFATRSPHRPNPIGLSCVRIERVEGLVVHVRELDLLDGTPVLDIKPYVAYTDAHPAARNGWLDDAAGRAGVDAHDAPVDPIARFVVSIEPLAQRQAAWIEAHTGLAIADRIRATLALGPEPHPYRRIRRNGDSMQLSVKDWRVTFAVAGREVTVRSIRSGYSATQLDAARRSVNPSGAAAPRPHLDFVARFAHESQGG